MTDIDRVYKLTARRAPDIGDIEGFDRSFFEELETITEITAHRIEFKIEKTLGKEPNRCELILTNLSSVTRDEFTAGQVRVRFEAGYDNTPRLLFVGDVRFASNELEGTEWRTKLQIGDGARAYAEALAPARAYAPKTPIDTILRDLARAFGVQLPPEVAASPELRARIAAGEVLSGYASDELTRLLAPFGYEWSFQDGRLQILRYDQVRAGVIRVISQDDGMIGAPAIEPPKIRAGSKRSKPKAPRLTVKHLLYPDLTPGERLEIRSRSINGTYRADKVSHEGDTEGSDWTTTIEATEL